MNNTKLQAILASVLGDGSIRHLPSKNVMLYFSTISKEYGLFKNSLLENDKPLKRVKNNGYKRGYIYRGATSVQEDILYVSNLSLKEKLDLLDKLGLAMWFYEDGSLHKTKLFYNLCTHSFSELDHINYLLPYFRSIGLNPILRYENKKDGRKFFYISFNKRDNAVWISDLLEEIGIEYFNYKVFPPNSYLKGYIYKEDCFLELKQYSVNKNIPFREIQKLRREKKIRVINYLDVQRLSKPLFFTKEVEYNSKELEKRS